MNKEKIEQNLYKILSNHAALEYLKITEEEIKIIIEKHNHLNFKFEEVMIIENLKDAYSNIIDEKLNFNPEKPLLLLSIFNSIIGKGIVKNAGMLREKEVIIKGSSYIPPKPNLINLNNQLIKNLEEITIDNILKNHIFCMKYQAFNDGNKRSAFLFTNFLLMKHFDKILTIPSEKMEEFRNYFIDYYENKNSDRELIDFLKSNLI